MDQSTQQCINCQHKMNGILDGAGYFHCGAHPENKFVGGKSILDFRYCASVRAVFPICPDYTPKVSWWQRIKQFFTGTK